MAAGYAGVGKGFSLLSAGFKSVGVGFVSRNTGTALSFTIQPQSQTVDEYASAAFSCEVTGGVAPYAYQWKKSGVNAGVNSAALSFTSSTTDNGTSITVIVTDSAGTSITSTVATLVVTSYAFKLDGLSQYFSMDTAVSLAVGDKTIFKFKAAPSTGATRVLFCNASNTSPFKVYLLNGLTIQNINNYHDTKLDGVTIFEGYTMPTDGEVHEIEFTHKTSGDIKVIGATPVPSAFSNQSFFDLRFVRAAGNITIPLNNKSQGAAQLATVGARTANIINYNPAGWLVK